jgi:hypothetical protein
MLLLSPQKSTEITRTYYFILRLCQKIYTRNAVNTTTAKIIIADHPATRFLTDRRSRFVYDVLQYRYDYINIITNDSCRCILLL